MKDILIGLEAIEHSIHEREPIIISGMPWTITRVVVDIATKVTLSGEDGAIMNITAVQLGAMIKHDFLMKNAGEQMSLDHNMSMRLRKVLMSGKDFLIITDTEPYYRKAYAMIRRNEQENGTWTEEDESRFRDKTNEQTEGK